MKDYVGASLKHIGFFYVRPIERKLWHFEDAQNLATLCKTGVFWFLGYKFVISEPIFKIYL